MKERPILFSGPMVRAILDGRKTVTRRAVKVRGGLDYIGPGQDAYDVADPGNYGYEDGYGDFHTLDQRLPALGMLGGPPYRICCPYGVPGDRLWVRETFKDFKNSGETLYRADFPSLETTGGWTPSIHMPRWASRITLEVTEVRVERLQEISEADARAEGVKQPSSGCWLDYEGGDLPYLSARDSFSSLWRSINGAESWDLNPWVWAISFRRLP